MINNTVVTLTTNPLLDFSHLIHFDKIKIEHITPAIDILLTKINILISTLEIQTSNVTWSNYVEPLENATEQLNHIWGIVEHLNAVNNTPELRTAYKENQPKVIKFRIALSHNLILYNKYKILQSGSEYKTLSTARKKVIDNIIRDFRLSGAELKNNEKILFAKIQEKIAILTTRFSENVLDATNEYALYITNESKLSGLPDDTKQAACLAAKNDKKHGFKFTLHFPSFFPILKYANNRGLRKQIYQANVTKASEFGNKLKWDNTKNIKKILALRRKEAILLGFTNFAELSLTLKMAESPQKVIYFLEDLGQHAYIHAKKDWIELSQFAKKTLHLNTIKAWDIAYVTEKLREQNYNFSEQELKQYFPISKVLTGLFQIIKGLFNVDVLPDTAPIWNKDVDFFRIESPDGQLIGQFYLDLYARTGNKRSGAWMDSARARRMTTNGIQTPIAYLICNFTAPTFIDKIYKSVLLTHEDVITLFHEIGHGLHHLLTQINEINISGISGVEWDAIELPSQFMENFCWEWSVLQNISSHVKTGMPIPHSLFKKITSAKNFQSGLKMLYQIELSLFDIYLHYNYDAVHGNNVQNILNRIRKKIAIIQPPKFNRFQNSFSHIFAGGYAAGYYSYKWAEVLSADVYSAFEEDALINNGNIISTKLGQRFLQEILAVGSSRPAIESFKAFRGREPNIEALLRHNDWKLL